MTNVLLLREPTEDGQDRYEAIFTEAGYYTVSIPVLETAYTNVENLRDIIHGGPHASGLDGVIVTSKRSCDAWREALRLLRDARQVNQTRTGTEKGGIDGWCDIPFYVVGESTAALLRTIFEEFRDLGLTSVDLRGQESGSAAKLAPFILEVSKEGGKTGSMLFYLTGDKNRDTLPRLLEEGGLQLHSLQVYKTQMSSHFEQILGASLASSPQGVAYWWIVYFAPSSAAFVTSLIRKKFKLEENDFLHSDQSQLLSRIAAIGPTTHSFLVDELHLKVHVAAQKPTPEDLLSTIQKHDKDYINKP